ncbi:serine/threonine protein phosphatase [Rhizobium deserti]|uniref:Serine/threonine protein phosphatase n=1 Tax=Rhizobium deserti TaxID=2547961 RepID=A0A4R5UJQ4_9HYPH|nr:metallophosphoesterase family protein [Rhizobium deserti]TDK36983.1 serine/threonine protein phosphatase [Rhizobium deserti]
MRRLTGWLWRNAPPPEPAPLRRRIDLGEKAPGFPIYAIGDVHGCLDHLLRAEERIAADIRATGRRGPVIFLGDYVDRGPASAQVIDHLIAPSPYGLKRVCLCGNHDDIFSAFIPDPDRHLEWLALGGEQTLMSYGIDIHHVGIRPKGRNGKLKEMLAHAVPQAHRDFLLNLPVSLKIGSLLFVHAGIRPGVALNRQDNEDMIWIREPFLTEGPRLPSLLVIHGHTPSTDASFGAQRIGIDTGAFYSGKLTVLKIEDGLASVL